MNRLQILLRALVLGVVVLLAACTSPEERAAAYIATAEEHFAAEDFVKAELEAKNAIQIEPNNPEARWLLAQILEKQGDFQGVFENLRIAVDADPTLTEARVKLASLYVAAGMTAEARGEIDAVIAQNPDNLDARTLAARMTAQSGDLIAAEAELREILSEEPGKIDALVLLVGVVAAERPEEALELLNGGMSQTEDTRTLRLVKIEILQRLDQKDAVEAEYRALIAEYPEEGAFRYRLAQFLLSDGRFDDVEQTLREIVEAEPDSLSARIALIQFLANVRGPEAAEESLDDFIAQAPEDYGLLLAKGRLLEATDRSDEAMDVYLNIAENAGNTDEALTAKNQIARLLLREEKVEEGRVYIDEVLEIDSSNIEALMMHGGLALVDKDHRQAVTDFRNVLRKEPDQERALYLLARTHLSAGDKVLAKDAYRRVIDVNPANAVAAMELTQILYADEQFDEAEKVLRGRLKAVPDDARASQMLIGLLVNQKRYSVAATEARRLIDAGEDTGLAYYLLGGALQVQGKTAEAKKWFAKALEVAPNSPEALQGYVATVVELDGEAAAKRYLEQHIKNNPDQLNAQTLLSRLQAGSGDMQGAEQTLKGALQKNEAWLPAYTGLASMQSDDIGAQIEIYEQGIEAIPGNQQLGLLLGTAYEREGRIDDAIEMYEGLLEQNPDMPAVVNNLAALVADYRQDDTAYLRKVLQLTEQQKLEESENPAFLDTVGWVQYRLGNYEVAVDLLEKAVEGAKQVPILHYHLGMAYKAAGNNYRAREELNIAISTAKSDFTGIEDAKAALEELKNGQ